MNEDNRHDGNSSQILDFDVLRLLFFGCFFAVYESVFHCTVISELSYGRVTRLTCVVIATGT